MSLLLVIILVFCAIVLPVMALDIGEEYLMDRREWKKYDREQAIKALHEELRALASSPKVKKDED